MKKGYRVRHKEKDTGFKWESQASEMEKVEGEGRRRKERTEALKNFFTTPSPDSDPQREQQSRSGK